MAIPPSPPVEVMPPPSARKYRTRRGVAEWLVERLAEDTPALVGIDHGFSFPLRYFEEHGLKPVWPFFLEARFDEAAKRLARTLNKKRQLSPTPESWDPIYYCAQ